MLDLGLAIPLVSDRWFAAVAFVCASFSEWSFGLNVPNESVPINSVAYGKLTGMGWAAESVGAAPSSAGNVVRSSVRSGKACS